MPRKTRADLRRPLDSAIEEIRQEEAAEAKLKKQGFALGSTRKEADDSWLCVGGDISLSSIALVAIGFDAKLGKHHVDYADVRWLPDDDYYQRLGDAARAYELILDVGRKMYVISPERTFVAFEEAVHYGALQRGIAGFAKQQLQVSGAFIGGLVRYGFPNLEEINNSQWYKTLRGLGVEYESVPRGSTRAEKDAIGLANKERTKQWAMAALGLPDLPDLVRSKTGAKIPRPESGFGANAKAVQPNDVYDAAGICVHLLQSSELATLTELVL